jgi:serine/threonine-protein kinase
VGARLSFGAYELLGRLATGGSAHILLARHRGRQGYDRLVVVKTLLTDRMTAKDTLELFLDEGRLGQRLDHPNIARAFEFGRYRSIHYIAMEFIFGHTLFKLLFERKNLPPMPQPIVAALIAAACDGLQFAHRLTGRDGRPLGLIHRDISTQNIMLTYDGRTKILDFGIAKAGTSRSDTATGVVRGKGTYMSPEQIAGMVIDQRADLYSLGVVMFECLTGRKLLRPGDLASVARQLGAGPTPRASRFRPELAPELDDICHRALARVPPDRFQTAAEFGHALRVYLARVPKAVDATAISTFLADRLGPIVKEQQELGLRALRSEISDSELSGLGLAPLRELDLPLGPILAAEPEPGVNVEALWSAEHEQTWRPSEPATLEAAGAVDGIDDTTVLPRSVADDLIRATEGALKHHAPARAPSGPPPRAFDRQPEAATDLAITRPEEQSDAFSSSELAAKTRPADLPIPPAATRPDVMDVLDALDAPAGPDGPAGADGPDGPDGPGTERDAGRAAARATSESAAAAPARAPRLRAGSVVKLPSFETALAALAHAPEPTAPPLPMAKDTPPPPEPAPAPAPAPPISAPPRMTSVRPLPRSTSTFDLPLVAPPPALRPSGPSQPAELAGATLAPRAAPPARIPPVVVFLLGLFSGVGLVLLVLMFR